MPRSTAPSPTAPSRSRSTVNGLDDLWIVVELDDGVRAIPIDDDFEAAIAQHEAVWRGNKLCVRARPVN